MSSEAPPLIALALALVPAGCTPVTPEALIREEQRAYEQAEREAAFFRDKRKCADVGGVIVIERMGRARRRDVVRKMPGFKDEWYCQL